MNIIDDEYCGIISVKLLLEVRGEKSNAKYSVTPRKS